MSLADRVYDLADGRVRERLAQPPKAIEAPPPSKPTVRLHKGPPT
jgi:hypothetical protein